MKLSVTQRRLHVCVCVSEGDCLGGDMLVCVCSTKRRRRWSCSPQHLTAFHLLLLLDQPRATVTSPFPALTSHAPSLGPVTIGSRASTRTFWLAGWSLFCQTQQREGNRDSFYSVSDQPKYANWMDERYLQIYLIFFSSLAAACQDPVCAIYLGDLFTWKMS